MVCGIINHKLTFQNWYILIHVPLLFFKVTIWLYEKSFVYLYSMKWEKVNITDRILYLKKVLLNSTEYKDKDEYIVDALITGSRNTFSGEMGFEIEQHHLYYLRELWDKHIVTQKDNSVINELRERG